MTTDTNRELTLTRTFDAPRRLVWYAYTVPEQLAKWWGPSIMHTPLETITIDLRPGGAFNLTMVSNLDGANYPSEMVVREVVPIERLCRRGFGRVCTCSIRFAGSLVVDCSSRVRPAADDRAIQRHRIRHRRKPGLKCPAEGDPPRAAGDDPGAGRAARFRRRQAKAPGGCTSRRNARRSSTPLTGSAADHLKEAITMPRLSSPGRASKRPRLRKKRKSGESLDSR